MGKYFNFGHKLNLSHSGPNGQIKKFTHECQKLRGETSLTQNSHFLLQQAFYTMKCNYCSGTLDQKGMLCCSISKKLGPTNLSPSIHNGWKITPSSQMARNMTPTFLMTIKITPQPSASLSFSSICVHKTIIRLFTGIASIDLIHGKLGGAILTQNKPETPELDPC